MATDCDKKHPWTGVSFIHGISSKTMWKSVGNPLILQPTSFYNTSCFSSTRSSNIIPLNYNMS